jgi:hypothetical protein
MNSSDLDALKAHLSLRLREHGPATVDELAFEVNAPHDNVRFALTELRGTVKALPFGFWDLAEEHSNAA